MSSGGGESNASRSPGAAGTSGAPAVTDVGPGYAGEGGAPEVFEHLPPWTPSTLAPCPGEAQLPPDISLSLMFVVDVSESMLEPVSAGVDVTRWDVIRGDLETIIDALPSTASMGIVYFPNAVVLARDEPSDDPSACVGTDALIGPELMSDEQRARLKGSLADVTLAGGSPTVAGYAVGLEALKAAGADLPVNRYVVLITDGEPTYGQGCVGDGTRVTSSGEVLKEVEAAGQGSPSIATFVVGAPGSEIDVSGSDARPWLSEAASFGGTAPLGCVHQGPSYCHIDLTNLDTDLPSELRSAFNQILGSPVSCEYSMPDPPAGQVRVADLKYVDSDGQEYRIPGVAESGCRDQGNGWYYSAPTEVTLCAATCSRVTGDDSETWFAGGAIEVLYGCEPVPEVPMIWPLSSANDARSRTSFLKTATAVP